MPSVCISGPHNKVHASWIPYLFVCVQWARACIPCPASRRGPPDHKQDGIQWNQIHGAARLLLYITNKKTSNGNCPEKVLARVSWVWKSIHSGIQSWGGHGPVHDDSAIQLMVLEILPSPHSGTHSVTQLEVHIQLNPYCIRSIVAYWPGLLVSTGLVHNTSSTLEKRRHFLGRPPIIVFPLVETPNLGIHLVNPLRTMPSTVVFSSTPAAQFMAVSPWLPKPGVRHYTGQDLV